MSTLRIIWGTFDNCERPRMYIATMTLVRFYPPLSLSSSTEADSASPASHCFSDSLRGFEYSSSSSTPLPSLHANTCGILKCNTTQSYRVFKLMLLVQGIPLRMKHANLGNSCCLLLTLVPVKCSDTLNIKSYCLGYFLGVLV